MDYNRFFIRDPAICGGELIIKGTRVTVRTVLASLALTCEAIRAVIAFAAASAEDDLPLPPVPAI